MVLICRQWLDPTRLEFSQPLWTYVILAGGPVEASVGGVQRDLVSVVQVLVGTEGPAGPFGAAEPQQLQTRTTCF